MDLPTDERWISIDTAVLYIAKRHMTALSGEWWTGLDLARHLIECRLASGLLEARPSDFRDYFLYFKGTHPDGHKVDLRRTLKNSSELIPRVFWIHFRDAKRLARGYPYTRLVQQGDQMVSVEDFDRALPHARMRGGNFSFLQTEEHLIDGIVTGEANAVLVDSLGLTHRKKPGRKSVKKYSDDQFFAEMALLIDAGDCSIREAAKRIGEKYRTDIPGYGTLDSKIDRIRKNFTDWAKGNDGGNLIHPRIHPPSES